MSEQIGVLERAAAIAKDSLTKIEAPAKEKAASEAKVAEVEKVKLEQIKKDEGIKKVAEQEAKAKEDERILTVEDKELSEPELKRKVELKETKRKEDESPDAKIKRVQDASQKRIDEIKSELLSEREHTKQEMAALKAELEDLKKPKQQEDAAVKSKRDESERIAKYIDEDKTKPKEDRREMSKQDLEEWFLEDPLATTEWIQDRTLRRSEERKKANEADKPLDTVAEKQRIAKEFVDKQIASRTKLLAKFPGISVSKEQVIEAKKEAGVPLDRNLTEEEASKVNEKLDGKSEMFRLCREITFSDPKKYIESPDGPELVMAEMERRLADKGNKSKTYTQEDFDAKVQAEIERRKLVDGEGINSSNGGKKVENSNKNKSELRQMQEKIAKKAGISVEALDKSIARRVNIPGANSGGADD